MPKDNEAQIGDGMGRSPLSVDEFDLVSFRPGHDAAVTKFNEDLLGRWPIAHAIYRHIYNADGEFSTRIGLYGEWGAGKTSVLNFLRAISEHNDDVIIHFSAWRAAEIDAFMTSLSDSLKREIKRRELKTSFRFKLNSFFSRASRNSVAIAEATGQAAGKLDGELSQMITAGAAFTGAVAKAVEQRLNFSADEVESLREILREHKIIVFIDDLDRADPKILPKIFMALREYLDWPGFSFVLSFDKAVILDALNDYSSAFASAPQPFLEKIVDVVFDLKRPATDLPSQMITHLLQEQCAFIPEKDRLAAAGWFPGNPRKIKSICRELQAAKVSAVRHGDGELSWEAIIVQTILRRESERLVEFVEREMLGRDKLSLGLSFTGEKKLEAAALLDKAMTKSGYAEGTPEHSRLYNMIVRLQGLRRLHDAQRISYEMQLSTHAPIFTQREVKEIIDTWDGGCHDDFVSDALRLGGERAFVTPTEATSKLLDMVTDFYVACVRGLRTSKVKSVKDETLAAAERAARFLLNIVTRNTASAGNLAFCIRILNMSIENDSNNDLEEIFLRVLEWQILSFVSEHCLDKSALFHECFPHEGSKVPMLAERVQQRTVSAAVESILVLFASANGVYMCAGQGADNRHLRWMLDRDALLYQSPHKKCLINFLQAEVDSSQVSIVAKNTIDYIGLVSNRMNSFSGFASDNRDLIEACWRAIIRENWNIKGQQDVEHIKSRLEGWGGVSGLSLPQQW
ncbi:P-loop NTPase fold protein [Pseudomonas sp. CJQ_11]|uniref:KAP family P-loop NTPase fold protein n=1 Tax=Pseudomonas sp. CJQ_11 TaxID=3367169 RepID=UPI00370C3C63